MNRRQFIAGSVGSFVALLLDLSLPGVPDAHGASERTGRKAAASTVTGAVKKKNRGTAAGQSKGQGKSQPQSGGLKQPKLATSGKTAGGNGTSRKDVSRKAGASTDVSRKAGASKNISRKNSAGKDVSRKPVTGRAARKPADRLAPPRSGTGKNATGTPKAAAQAGKKRPSTARPQPLPERPATQTAPYPAAQPLATPAQSGLRPVQPSIAESDVLEPDLAPQVVPSVSAAPVHRAAPNALQSSRMEDDDPVRDYLIKMRHYDEAAVGDIILTPPRQALLLTVTERLGRLQRIAGHGHFYILGMDEAVRLSRRADIGTFTRAELDFLEELFHTDASGYGFLDKKPLNRFTAGIPASSVIKVPGMGNYVYKGDALKRWEQIRTLMGDDVVLTSGVRGVVKQFHLFLTKALTHGGNLSLASRSLAPPGYSFHGVGDFDVGQRGYGVNNFTSVFAGSAVFQRLSAEGFVTLRYPQDNFLGVRFEPWHVKVTSA